MRFRVRCDGQLQLLFKSKHLDNEVLTNPDPGYAYLGYYEGHEMTPVFKHIIYKDCVPKFSTYKFSENASKHQ